MLMLIDGLLHQGHRLSKTFHGRRRSTAGPLGKVESLVVV
jgi:hypothetical protein